MPYGFLADVVLVVHFLYVAYVVVGFLAIVAGIIFKWDWIRNPWFRWTHLAMIGIVALEAMLDFRCPLTDWEVDLRKLAGQKVEEGTFIGRLLNDIMFVNLPVDHWAFKVSYIGFGLLILGSFWLAPPRRRATQQIK